jgi:hypothetical protein
VIRLDDASFSELLVPQRQSLREWRTEVNAEKGTKVGLWICGKRRSGSTYIGKVAFNRVWSDHPEWNCQYLSALDLINQTRQTWDNSDLVAKHPYDDALWLEVKSAEVALEGFWAADLAWVDDWHLFDVDMKFWRRFIQPYVEQRVKERRPTIIATQILPDDPGLVELQRVIEHLFVVIHATR